MIGIDTNLLVRYFVQDDAGQVRQVDELIDFALRTGERLRISDIVLSELVWVLKTIYRIRKEEIVSALERMIANKTFAFEDPSVVNAAYADYRDGQADFPDYLIGRRNTASGCEHTVTFDKDLMGHPAFVVI